AVFRDYNADGAHDANEPGLAGVTVTAYDASGAVAATAPSGADGSYTLPGLTTGVEYRLEFTLPVDGSMDALSPSAVGANNGSSVQFADGGATGVDAGFYNPTEYAVAPLLFTSVMNGFDVINLAGQSFGDAKSSAAIAYNASGTGPTQTYIVPASEKGATYGVAWQPSSQMLFVSSYLKTMAGLGPTDTPGAAGGVTTGGIYLITPVDATNATATLFIDLQPIIDTGANPHPLPTDTCTSALFAGTTNGRCWIHEDILAEVGTVGLGDLDFNADGSVLYTVNLNTREVVAIPVGIPAVAPAAGDIVSYAAPTTDCANPADAQPFALAAHADDPDKMYVGVTCTAYSSQDPAELWAWVYEFDSGNGSFTPIFNSTLNYARPRSVGLWGNCTNANCPATWRPWQDDLSLMHIVAQSSTSTDPMIIAHPQPMVTDIVFDQGDLILGIRDRVADQVGDRAGKPGDNTNARIWTAYSGGDMVRACADGAGGWTMEANAVCGGVTGAGPGTNEGPGGGEYYRDTFSLNGGTHPELNLGGLAQVPGFTTVAATTYDYAQVFEGAVRKWNNATGAQASGARIYRETGGEWEYFSKTNGLGDLEVLNEAAPIEVGNRVWADTNGNGAQDPGEPPIAGVTVTLHDSSGAPLAAAVTDANGNYLFSNGAGTNTASVIYNISGLTYNTSGYEIRIANAEGGSQQAPLSGLFVTAANADADQRDSDGTLNGSTAQVAFATGAPGANNHTYDFGFSSTALPQIEIVKQLNTPLPVTVGALISFTIRITNTGTVSITQLPLTDDYDTTYIDYSTTADATGPNPATEPANDGSILWNNVIDFDVDGQLDPNETLDIIVWFNAKAETTGLPGGASSCDTAGHTYNNAQTIGQTACVEVSIDPPEPKLTLGDVIWHDINNNGVQDANEPGIDGVLVNLYEVTGSGTSFVISTTTATTNTVSGFYQFAVPSGGAYQVEVDSSNFAPGGALAGFVLGQNQPNITDDADPDQTAINVTTNDNTLDFGFYCRFDLALDKKLAAGQPATIAPGDDVTFTMTIYNQGVVTATNIVIADYIPTGFTLNDSNWSGGPTGTVTRTLAATLTPSGTVGSMTTADIVLTADASLNGVYTNTAEIASYDSSVKDALGNNLPDADSTPDAVDGNGSNGNGGESTDLEDDQINEDGKNMAGADEDDHDPAQVTVIALVPTLAVSKQLNGVNPFSAGATIHFTIRITNTGAITLTVLPLTDRYSNAFIEYESASIAPDPGSGNGVVTWSDLTTALGDLAPQATASLVVTFTTLADTTLLTPVAPCTNGGHTPNIVDIDGAFADPDGDDGVGDDLVVVKDGDDRDCAEVQILNPTGIQLAARSLTQTPDGVLVRWTTINESDIAGFHIWRSNGVDAQRLSPQLIVAKASGQTSGTSYEWLDAGATLQRGDTYVLEIVKVDGSSERTVIDVMTGVSLYLPLLAR
ncbi:MAG: DUF11 domain-containing protein, partial [Caldilineaceae bacterium]|nr:DUF11 domain-containing protein [Caldilineaceae bacterium]